MHQLAIGGSSLSRRIGWEVLPEHHFNQDQAGLLNASGAGLLASQRPPASSSARSEWSSGAKPPWRA
jgi:hypothetical protein